MTDRTLEPLAPGDEPTAVSQRSALPARLGRYEVLGLLARGGMGAVYKARDPALDRVVAVKTVQAILLETDMRDEFLERFRREARAAGRLAHPHIVSVHDFGVDEATATPFIVMEYVAGASLETMLKGTPTLSLDQALGIVDQVTQAVAEAHAHGIVHRDIKPANVYLDERGRVKVGDFGIARVEGSDLTEAGVSLGTPGYTAPEIVQGQAADARSDVFALGSLAYRLLTGEKPFRGVTRETIALDVLQWQPPPPDAVRPEIPAHVAAAVMRALAKAPAERTATAEEFARELRAPATARDGPPALPPPVRTPTPTPATIPTVPVRPERTRLWPVIAALAGAVALLIGLGLVYRSRQAPDADPAAALPPPPKTVRPAAAAPIPAATTRPAPRPPAAPHATADPRLEQLKDVLEDVLQAQGAKGPPPQGQAPGSRGKGHGKGKKH